MPDFSDLINNLGKTSDHLEKITEQDTEKLRQNIEELNEEIEQVSSNLSDVAKGFKEARDKGSRASKDLNRELRETSKTVKAIQEETEKWGKVYDYIGGKLGALVQGVKIATNVYTKYEQRVIEARKMTLALSGAHGRATDAIGRSTKQVLTSTQAMYEYASRAPTTFQEMAQSFEQTSAYFNLDQLMSGINNADDATKSFIERLNGYRGALLIARRANLDVNSVLQETGQWVSELGTQNKDVTKTWLSMSEAAKTAGMSTKLLFPLLQNLRQDFRYIGLEGSSAAFQMSRVAEAANKARERQPDLMVTGALTAAQIQQRAMTGLGQQQFGTQTFLAQRLGIGPGGLAGGFAFRQAMRGEGGATMPQNVVSMVGQMFGGNPVTSKDVKDLPKLAGTALAQEQLLASMLNISQLEARQLIDLQSEIQQLPASSEQRKNLEDQAKDIITSEKTLNKQLNTTAERIEKHAQAIYAHLATKASDFYDSFSGFLSKFERLLGGGSILKGAGEVALGMGGGFALKKIASWLLGGGAAAAGGGGAAAGTAAKVGTAAKGLGAAAGIFALKGLAVTAAGIAGWYTGKGLDWLVGKVTGKKLSVHIIDWWEGVEAEVEKATKQAQSTSDAYLGKYKDAVEKLMKTTFGGMAEKLKAQDEFLRKKRSVVEEIEAVARARKDKGRKLYLDEQYIRDTIRWRAKEEGTTLTAKQMQEQVLAVKKEAQKSKLLKDAFIPGAQTGGLVKDQGLVYVHKDEMIVPKEMSQTADIDKLASIIGNIKTSQGTAVAQTRQPQQRRETIEKDVKLNLQVEFDRLIRKTVSLLISEEKLAPGMAGVAQAGMTHYS